MGEKENVPSRLHALYMLTSGVCEEVDPNLEGKAMWFLYWGLLSQKK